MATTTRTVTVTVTLTDEDLREAVTTWAKGKGLIESAYDCTVKLVIKERSTGYGMHESREPYAEVVLTQGGST